MILGYSLEPPMSEEQYLARELGVVWTHTSSEELSRRLHDHGRQVVICSDPLLYLDVLQRAPSSSVVLILVSDEGYSRERRMLAGMASVVLTLRNYAAVPISGSQIVRAMRGFVGDARRGSTPVRSVIPLTRSGLRVRTRMGAWSTTFAQTLPLGYTNVFAEALAPGGSDSLLDIPHVASTVDTAPSAYRPITVSFRGNRGLATRILGLEAIRELSDSRITLVDAAWSGDQEKVDAQSYVSELAESRFALCPPGFINTETFRFYEALICGALPVEIASAVTHLGVTPFRDRITIQEASWSQALRRIRNMPELERVERVERARTLLRSSIHECRERIVQMMVQQ